MLSVRIKIMLMEILYRESATWRVTVHLLFRLSESQLLI